MIVSLQVAKISKENVPKMICLCYISIWHAAVAKINDGQGFGRTRPAALAALGKFFDTDALYSFPDRDCRRSRRAGSCGGI